jgi:acyl dehydratase
MRVFDGPEDLRRSVGQELGSSPWLTITQGQVDEFARATGDHQWIHVDREAASEGPFGTTIAHGYLTLSLVSAMSAQIYEIGGVSMVLNYGSERVRFPTPVRVNSRVRGSVELVGADEVSMGIRVTTRVTVSIENGSKPACVADVLSLVVP